MPSFTITTSIETSSSGAWQGDNPLDFAFPLLIVQTTLVVLVSRSLAFLLKPLRQPKVIAEILGGILLGPSALGRSKAYLHRVFPPWSTPLLESVASIGLLYFLFLVGLELDVSSIRRSGRCALSIAAAGVSLPFICGIGVAFLFRNNSIDGADKVGFGQFLVFMGVSLSITAFPVLARILAELKLLTTQVGEIAMAAAAVNDVLAWVMLALAVAITGNNNKGSSTPTTMGGTTIINNDHHKSPLISIWVSLSGIAFVVFMFVAVRPVMGWVAKRCSPEHDVFICVTLAGVMVSGFITDLIGIHSIFGAFVFGLTIPKEGEFAGKLIEKIEDLVSGLLLPLYFASSGLKTNVTKMRGVEAWGLLGLVVATACVGKIVGTFVVAMLNKMAARDALTLGLLMNTKGLIELIVLNIGKEKKVLNDEIFAILVLMALVTTFLTTPTAMAAYKPAGRTNRKLHTQLQQQPKKDLRILACVHDTCNIPSLIRLTESTRGGIIKTPLKLYVMHLVELTERSSSIVLVQRVGENRSILRNRLRRGEPLDRIMVAMEAYGQLGRVKVRPMTAISGLQTMHEDVCHAAADKRVNLLILPFYKRRQVEGCDDGSWLTEYLGSAWRAVYQRVMDNAPCSVAVLVDCGFGGGGPDHTPLGPTASLSLGVCVVFLGGPDDREALALGGRMAEHPGLRVTVLRFLIEREEAENTDGVISRSSPQNNVVTGREMEMEQDEMVIAEFRNGIGRAGLGNYVEKVMSRKKHEVAEEVVAVGRSGEYELIVVGKGRFPTWMMAELGEREMEHVELGPIGDALASSGNGVVSSVLVIQQHGEVAGSKGVNDDAGGSSSITGSGSCSAASSV